MNNKKSYASPEVEIEKFVIHCGTAFLSQGDPNGLDGGSVDYAGGDDWDF